MTPDATPDDGRDLERHAQEPTSGAPHAPANGSHDGDGDVVPLTPEPEPESERDARPAREPQPAAKPTPAAPRPAEPERPKRPVVRSSHYEWALAVAGCTAAVLVTAAFAGQRGLFPVPVPPADGVAAPPVDPGIGEKVTVAFRTIVRVALGGGCLVAGAYFLHFLDRRPVGDLRALASRMLAVAALALLVTLLPFDSRWLKQGYDVLVPVAAAWALMLLFFRLSPRDSAVVVLGAFISLTVLALGSWIVSLAVF